LHFICVPTPMKENGACYTKKVVDLVRKISKNNRTGADLIIKSTVSPGATKKLNKKIGRVFFNPEFLTEANSYDDFVNLPYQIIGNPGKSRSELLIKLYTDAQEQGLLKGGSNIIECDSTVAEMVKLTRNAYLATRLSFFNEINQICNSINVPFDLMKELAGMDERVGNHYNKVPGPDGKLGFGGSCLCKDINSLMYVARKFQIEPSVLRGVWEKNLEVRPERDWENLIGRAVLKASEEASETSEAEETEEL